MSKGLIIIFGAAMLLVSLALVSAGQVRRVTTIQNPDGTYTIVEYPVGRETVVTLSPVGLTAARGRATILRDPSGTTIKLNLTSFRTTARAAQDPAPSSSRRLPNPQRP